MNACTSFSSTVGLVISIFFIINLNSAIYVHNELCYMYTMNSAIYVHNLSLVGSRTDEFDELINDKFITHFLGFMNFHICIQSMSK